MINIYIKKLLCYAIERGLLESEDETDTANQLLELFMVEEFQEPSERYCHVELEPVLEGLLDYADEHNLLKENTVVYRDLFDTRIMGRVIPKPSVVIREFNRMYQKDPQAATDYFYRFCQDSDYIRRYRISKDLKWLTETQYGKMDITVNLSKPEKDPRDIAAAKKIKPGGYPKCLLCKENEGYAGRVNHPARQNHRIIPITLQGRPWGFQYSPYVYYNEHCIVFNMEHLPMSINSGTFRRLLDFVRQFPHYFIGSNADLPIVGGSILTHDHFQGGNYEFAMSRAAVGQRYSIAGFDDVEVGVIKWPMSVIRLSGADPDRVAELSGRILSSWRQYSDESVFVFAKTDGEPHNTITPIARMRDGKYEMDLVLRNNITTAEHPLGVFHPHSELHHIKKENIGLIEVMGLAVLPARLKSELEQLSAAILQKKDLRTDADLNKHADWVEQFLPQYQNLSAENITAILRQEVGYVFERVLEDAGVFKRNQEGQDAFSRFLTSI